MSKELLIVLIVLIASCQKSAIRTENLEIKSGQSFGECIGACTQIMTVNSSKDEVEYRAKYLPIDGSHQDSTFRGVISTEILNVIFKEVDTRKFFDLDSVYGCPDCADGGAEFIEITENGLSHRVTFEYGSTVSGIDGLVKVLRKERLKWGKKFLP